MNFDYIIGNPPYQENDGGGTGSSSVPLYHHFVNATKPLALHGLELIIPAKWQAGGKGLDQFRIDMLHDKHIRKMITFADSRDCFSGVDVAGGVSIFLRSEDYHGKCECEYIENGVSDTALRDLSEFEVFIPSNKAASIVRHIKTKSTGFYDSIVRPRNPFGIFGNTKAIKGDDILLRDRYGNHRIPADTISSNHDLIDQWKVIISKTSAEHAGQADTSGKRKIISICEVLPPKSVCSETYLVVDAFHDKEKAEILSQYLKTKFARYLIWQATPTQNISRKCFTFLPVIDLDKSVSDDSLYKLFNLTDEQKAEIDMRIKEMV